MVSVSGLVGFGYYMWEDVPFQVIFIVDAHPDLQRITNQDNSTHAIRILSLEEIVITIRRKFFNEVH